MGNHSAGKAMGLTAESLSVNRHPEVSALNLLDAICKPYSGCDAEFEACDPNRPGYLHPSCPDFRYPHPEMALGLLMLEAFAPNGLSDLERYRSGMDSSDDDLREKTYEDWYREVCVLFNRRYSFC